MKALAIAQRTFFSIHIASLIFGLAGLLLVLPNAAFIAQLPEFGQQALRWSMAGGGAVYMISGAIAVSIYAYRNLGLWHWLSFMLPALVVSVGAELLGTSTGFPFGQYHYLTGLGYKVCSRSCYEPNNNALLGVGSAGRIFWHALSKLCGMVWYGGCFYGDRNPSLANEVSPKFTVTVGVTPRHLSEQLYVCDGD